MLSVHSSVGLVFDPRSRNERRGFARCLCHSRNAKEFPKLAWTLRRLRDNGNLAHIPQVHVSIVIKEDLTRLNLP
jgi:hypothetical protein